nr:piggyBac transposable element-derived protein 4-like [Onthophagus taurus]
MGDFEREQARLLALWEDVQSEIGDYDEISSDEGEIDNLNESDHNSDTEQDISDDEKDIDDNDNNQIRAGLFYLGKDGATKWFKHPPWPNVRTRSENIVTQLPVVRRGYRDGKTALECWKYFFTDEMLEVILNNTNERILMRSSTYGQKDQYKVKQTDKTELLALFGLLYLGGYYKSGRQNVKDLWATDDTGVLIFRKTMTLQRFNFLLCCLRFDSLETRIERVALDKLAPIRTIFDAFVLNCKQIYSPSMYLTVDEQLIAFWGNCPFRQFIPSKPSKYGIKMFALTDARCFYTVNLEVYVGLQPEGPFRKSNKPEDIVLRLIEPVTRTGRNITFDNWFTSYSLIQRLLTEHRLTAVGTVRKNKKELPKPLVSTQGRPLPSSMFGFQKQITMVSYMGKKNKNVLMWSSLHHDDKIDESTRHQEKPDIVTFYNLTKGVTTNDLNTENEMCTDITQPIIINRTPSNSNLLTLDNQDSISMEENDYQLNSDTSYYSSSSIYSTPVEIEIPELDDESKVYL